MSRVSGLLVALWLALPAAAPAQNLLRNGNFQDDWLTLMPELKNHHWCYSSEYYNRRDFNPDGWTCKGSWIWLNEDLPAIHRRLVLQGPGATLSQRVNWVLVHDGRSMGTMADAGGFPQIKPQHSTSPFRMVGALTFKVLMNGKDVPAKAGVLELALCPPGQIAMSDPLGTVTPPTILATVPIPEGSFVARSVEVKLNAEQWLEAARNESLKNKKADDGKAGPVLPGTASVAIRYLGPTGSIELLHAELTEARSNSPNLLPKGDFEGADVFGDAKTAAWSGPTKYRYFPGRLYYLFNTWHNGGFDNRGKVYLDSLVAFTGQTSLQMIVPPGDEMAVASRLVTLNQKEPNLIEVQALVKTDRLTMLHLDALDEKGNRLDGYPFIHMAPHSIGTNDWRLIRQVFRPRQPLQSVRVLLCARGVNGYTLDDTGHQPQNNVVGTVWWDDVKLYEPESTKEELVGRGVMPAASIAVKPGLQLRQLELGERMLGDNVLTAQVYNPGKKNLRLQFEFTSPTGKKSSFIGLPQPAGKGDMSVCAVPYFLDEPCPDAYTEYRGKLNVLDDKNQAVAATELWFGTWTVPIDIDLGALYLRPEQKQYVRMNLGLSSAAMKQVESMRLDIVRRGTGEVLKSVSVPAHPAVVAEQRKRIPGGLRDDFTNLLLADVDVSFLPVQPFHDPQRNWLVRVSACDKANKELVFATSPPFCRQAHEPAQPPVQAVSVKNNLLFVNSKPWMPWGVVYGHVPVYDGPADPGKYLDLHSLPVYSMYDRFTAAPYTRQANDFNCLRYVAGSITDPKKLDEAWLKDNLYASSVFVTAQPVFSLDELEKKGGGKDKVASYLNFCKTAPMVVSTVPGIEEAFGLFHEMTAEQLKGMEQVVGYFRQQTGKPVMVGHGGYWNRLEFEKVPFFDIYDPETEPLYPANLHTDLWPLVGGKDKAIWLRPQMYEDVPFERWRYHVLVELMRGCRGWQIAHGPGDPSLFRGLHGELEFLKPIAYTPPLKETGVSIEPAMEHWVRKHQGKTYLIAATTRALTLGRWRDADLADGPEAAGKRMRVTTDPHLFLSETNSYGADQAVNQGPSIHGVQNFPNARAWPAGTKLTQWVRLDDKARPANLVILAKSEGRWTHTASWGKFDPATLSSDQDRSLWFLRSFYRHSAGFLGWGTSLLDKGRAYIPNKTLKVGELPATGWTTLEVPLDKIGATGLVDGIGFAHEGGRVQWGRTSLVTPDGKESIVWGDGLIPPATELAKTRIHVAGLQAGSKIRVVFEDREIVAQNGFFVDDFRGQDLYQRFGGGPGVGHGNAPVAVHIYEIVAP